MHVIRRDDGLYVRVPVPVTKYTEDHAQAHLFSSEQDAENKRAAIEEITRRRHRVTSR